MVYYIAVSCGTPGICSRVGRNIPAAPSLVVATLNVSAMMVTEHSGRILWMRLAVDRPMIPAPITAILAIMIIHILSVSSVKHRTKVYEYRVTIIYVGGMTHTIIVVIKPHQPSNGGLQKRMTMRRGDGLSKYTTLSVVKISTFYHSNFLPF